jgi:hypothetical protein
MKPAKPPSIPTWMLEHCTPGGSNRSLSGDLEEEFRNGRSAAWYWRKVLGAIAIGCMKDVRNHRNKVAYAALWSMLAPAWLLVAAGATERAANEWHIWKFDWPWSALLSSALALAPGLIFLGTGAALYLALQICVMRRQHPAARSRHGPRRPGVHGCLGRSGLGCDSVSGNWPDHG